MIDYIAILDYDHLDNGLFLSQLATAVAARQKERGLLIHADSAYTERIIQTGVMREEARIRAMRDLNHRLIALLADHGVSAIGLNGHQRGLVSLNSESNEIEIDKKALSDLPSTPQWVLSALALGIDGERIALSLPRLTVALQQQLTPTSVYLFQGNEDLELSIPSTLQEIRQDRIGVDLPSELVPTGFDSLPVDLYLTTAFQLSSPTPRSLRIRSSVSDAT